MNATKKDVQIAVTEKVREYYVAKPLLGRHIKIDRIVRTEKFGDEINIYYEEGSRDDRIFLNGVEFVPKEKYK